MASIYDIVYNYIELFFPNEKLNKDQKKTIHREVKKLLNSGWCSSDLLQGFKRMKKKRPEEQTLRVSYLLKGTKPEFPNLLEHGDFYYHNELRLTSSAPKREIDYDSGEIRIINEPYFLEMKASYSVKDLIRYFSRQTRIKILDHEMTRYIGSFNWLLKTYGLEDILFMIDASVNNAQSEDLPMPSSPLDIQGYLKDARDARNEKVTETIHAGGNTIVKKKRTRASRNRRETPIR